LTPTGPIRADLAHARQARLGAGLRLFVLGTLSLVLATLLVGLSAWKLAFSDLPTLPDKAALWSLNQPPGITFLDRDGQVVATRGSRRGQAVGLSDLPPYVPQAFLAAEDRRFYSHPGVDATGVMRAAWADLQHRRAVQGGSTITQQVARNIFLSPDQTLRRKLQEAVLAWRIEQVMTKSEILDLYLNRIYFGEGAYGIEAAAQIYFGVSARNLTLAEAAVLAALPKAPTRLDPTNDLQAALGRSRVVLAEMREAGWITATQASVAASQPPALVAEKPEEEDFGYVLDLASQRARLLADNRAPDLIVRLTVDRKLQAAGAAVVRDGVAEGRGLGATQAALVALTPDGAVRALVGGRSYRDSPYNRATQAMRQPGSAFKPIVYATALEGGVRPQDVRVDQPIHFAGWSPENYGGGYSGAVTVADALARSINTISVRLAREVGPDKIAALARRFGLAMIPQHPSLPIALGAYEVDLLDLTSAYQVFQNQGRRIEPYLIQSVTNAHGDLLYRHPDTVEPQIYDPLQAGLMTRMMEGVISHGTGTRAAFGRPAAGKTGTSQNWRDAWFVGFTPDWAAGVWVGDDHGRPMAKVVGGDLPAEMWRKFMITAHDGLAVRDFPDLPEAGPTKPGTGPSEEVASAPDGQAIIAASTPDDAPPPASTPGPGPAPDARSPDPRSAGRPSDFYAGLAQDLDRDADGQPPQ
jgi:penicillin-binding protein 1A